MCPMLRARIEAIEDGGDEEAEASPPRARPLPTFNPTEQVFERGCVQRRPQTARDVAGCRSLARSLGRSFEVEPPTAYSDQASNSAPVPYRREERSAPNAAAPESLGQFGQRESGSTYANRPHLAASHRVSIVDRSSMMNRCSYPVDVNYCFTNRNNAFTCRLVDNTYGKGSGSIQSGQVYRTGAGAGQLDRSSETLNFQFMACRSDDKPVYAGLDSIDPPRGRCMSY